MANYTVFFLAPKKQGSIQVEAESEAEARQKAKPRLMNMYGKPVEIRSVSYDGPITDK